MVRHLVISTDLVATVHSGIARQAAWFASSAAGAAARAARDEPDVALAKYLRTRVQLRSGDGRKRGEPWSQRARVSQRRSIVYAMHAAPAPQRGWCGPRPGKSFRWPARSGSPVALFIVPAHRDWKAKPRHGASARPCTPGRSANTAPARGWSDKSVPAGRIDVT